MTYFHTVREETAAGFEIIFSVAVEEESPDDDFSIDTLDRIKRGDLCWFVARVEAFKKGVLLGTDYLGRCCYESPQQFIESSDYYGGMVENAVAEARMKLKVLGVPC